MMALKMAGYQGDAAWKLPDPSPWHTLGGLTVVSTYTYARAFFVRDNIIEPS